jgi:peptidoglycan-associated lipoprotein
MFARNKSYDQFLGMHKNARILFLLLSVVLFFTACTRKQAPTPVTDNVTGSESDFGGDYVPESGMAGDYGLGAEGLELRSGSDGISDGMYDGREMVEGVLPSVYFGFDSSAISAAERSKLQEAADYLKENPSMGLLVEGHCDWYGTAEYNLALGDRRAESVSNYLGTLGITPLRVDKLSKGSLEATSGLSKAQASEDRRADLILLK